MHSGIHSRAGFGQRLPTSSPFGRGFISEVSGFSGGLRPDNLTVFVFTTCAAQHSRSELLVLHLVCRVCLDQIFVLLEFCPRPRRSVREVLSHELNETGIAYCPTARRGNRAAAYL